MYIHQMESLRDVRYDQWVDGSLKITIFIGEDNNE